MGSPGHLRVIVCGSREWTNKRAIYEAIKEVAPDGKARNLTVVHGGCPRGADRLVHELLRGDCEVHPADWDAHGRAAGHIRNRKMAQLGADICLAFWDGKSRGTKNMIEEAEKAGIPVKIVWES